MTEAEQERLDRSRLEASRQKEQEQPEGTSPEPTPWLGLNGWSPKPGKRHSDLRLINRAVKQKWPIPEEMRPLAIQVLKDALNNATEYRDRIAAVRALSQLEAQNMQAAGEGQQQGGVSVAIRSLIVEVAREGEGKAPLMIEQTPPQGQPS